MPQGLCLKSDGFRVIAQEALGLHSMRLCLKHEMHILRAYATFAIIASLIFFLFFFVKKKEKMD
jgi:hypothetical protein